MLNLSGSFYRRTSLYRHGALEGYPRATYGDGGYSAVAPFAAAAPRRHQDSSAPWGPQPLTIAHVGQSLVRAGVEQWLKALIQFLDPRWAKVVHCLVTEEQFVDPEVAAEVGVTVEIGSRAEVRRIARQCDALLCWGPSDLGAFFPAAAPERDRSRVSARSCLVARELGHFAEELVPCRGTRSGGPSTAGARLPAFLGRINEQSPE